jgi:hypothetical protein
MLPVRRVPARWSLTDSGRLARYSRDLGHVLWSSTGTE